MALVSRPSYLRFRQPGAVLVAAGITTVGALPLAGARWWLAPVALIPLLVTIWAWRSGTDVGRDALRVRALAGGRTVPWSAVAELAPDARGRVSAVLTDGNALRLPGVYARDLPVIVSATGQSIEAPDGTQAGTQAGAGAAAEGPRGDQ
jgi:hypothetical protein